MSCISRYIAWINRLHELMTTWINDYMSWLHKLTEYISWYNTWIDIIHELIYTQIDRLHGSINYMIYHIICDNSNIY